MITRDYLPAEAPLIRTLNASGFEAGGVGKTWNQEDSIAGNNALGPTQSLAASSGYSKPHLIAQSFTGTHFVAAGNPYLPSSQGLSRFFAAPSVHLSPAGLWMSKTEGNVCQADRNPGVTDGNFATGSLKPRVLDKHGQRLPTVLKKALPLPPEDIRSVPHARLASPRPGTPPVVSIGMSDASGLPVPWSKTPELMVSAQSNGDLSLRGRPGSLADLVRERIRLDFDNIEIFIEEAFTH
jgi:hypothetical protein